MSTNDLYDLKTIRDWLRYCVSEFYQHDIYLGHGTDNPWQEARRLVLRSLNLPVDCGDDILDARLIKAEKDCLIERLKLRCVDRIPLAYILGEAEFAGINFLVSRDTLVPRSPFAELILSNFSQVGSLPANPLVLDMCTGSGCIGIACALHMDAAGVDLVDISDAALNIASQNVELYELGERVNIIQSNLFENISQHACYDLIVSNPPYVDAYDMSILPPEYLHEPELGLAAGEDGLDLVHDILREAGKFLSDEGWLVVEVGNSWSALEQAYPDLDFHWLSFEHGGHGVFAISAKTLQDVFLSSGRGN